MTNAKKRARRHAKMIRHKNKITIAGIVTDCAAAQLDSRVIIDIKANAAGKITSHGDYLVGSIVIPPARYKITGTGDNAVRVKRHLNHHQIRAKLFSLAKGMQI